jgi:hypothetical protein
MKVTTTYTAENKLEIKALRMMALNLQDAGLEVTLQEDTQVGAACLYVAEARRKRRTRQEIAQEALSRATGEAQP